MLKILKYHIDTKGGWLALFGLILTLVALLLTFWVYKQDQFEFVVTIDDEVNLIEIREQTPFLKIFYKDQNIIESEQELKILNITIKNEGQRILQSYYDTNQRFGVAVLNSKIVSFKIINASSKYLEEALKPSVNINKLLFSKVIFERSAFITLRVYLLQPKGIARTEIKPIGKIAGIDKVHIKYLDEPSGESPFFPTSLSPWQQAYVFVGWLFGSLLILTFLLVSVGISVSKFKVLKRKKRISKFRLRNPKLTGMQKAILRIYEDNWRLEYSVLLEALVDRGRGLGRREAERLLSYNVPSQGMHHIGWGLLLESFGNYFPSEIFQKSGKVIIMNPENREFLVNLLTDTKEISKRG